MKSNNAVLKNLFLVADGIELPAFSEKGQIYVITSNNSISGCVVPIMSYLNLLVLLLFTFLHPKPQNSKLMNCTVLSLELQKHYLKLHTLCRITN